MKKGKPAARASLSRGVFFKYGPGDVVFEIVDILIVTLICLSIIIPFLNLLSISFDRIPPSYTSALQLWPRDATLENYRVVFKKPDLWIGFGNTLFVTAVGTVCSLFVTVLASYALSKRRFPHRGFWTFLIIFTMYFNAGLIPKYLWINQLGLLNSRAALILPVMVGAYNFIIIRNFFQEVPEEIEEAAKIDGADDFRVLFQIIVPLSVPVIATVSLWLAVYYWSSWYDCMIYIKDTGKMVVQVILQRILSDGGEKLIGHEMYQVRPTSEGVKAACVFITTLPILCVYPFIQKYFVKGIYIGSVKG